MIERPISSRAAELAREFDRTFSEPRRAAADDREDLLALREGGQAIVARLRDVAGLFVDRKIVPLPSPDPAFLGIAGLRGGIIPVYRLAALLGRETRPEAPRWILVVRGEPLGLAFDELEGHVRADRGDLSGASDGRGETSVRIGEAWRGVIDLVDLVAQIAARRTGGEQKNDKET